LAFILDILFNIHKKAVIFDVRDKNGKSALIALF
jgi:hypothetical protein